MPTSARSFSSSCSSFSSPLVPGLAKRGAWLVEVAKFMLPRPPWPPFATTKRGQESPMSARSSPVAASFTMVPGGTLSSSAGWESPF